MFEKVSGLVSGKSYWLALIIFSFALEFSALFYQYVLDYLPCVLCIHVRIYLLGLILVALFALLASRLKFSYIVANILTIFLFAGFTERSYQLLGTERGFVFGDCNMELGVPAWMALDKWLPSVFKVHEACGYTPELLFGITMAEALMVLSVLLVLISVFQLVVFVMRLTR